MQIETPPRPPADMAPSIPRPDADEPLVLTSNATRILSGLGLERLVEKSCTLDQWRITSATGGADFATQANPAAKPCELVGP